MVRSRTGEWTRPVIATFRVAAAYCCIRRANERDVNVMTVVNSTDN